VVAGLQKFAGDAARSRSSSPKLQVYNTALMTAQSGLGFDDARADPEYWGRLTESAIGAHLLNAVPGTDLDLQYWRERNQEVDFVLRAARRYSALEVKTARGAITTPGLSAFAAAWKPARSVRIGDGGVDVEKFLTTPAAQWLER